MSTENPLSVLVSHTITKISWSASYLQFVTEVGNIETFTVEGDCCSMSYFHDFYGVAHLLKNGPVKSVKEITLDCDVEGEYGELRQFYGYELVTTHPVWGDVTSVLSFRNESNGYYGGWMEIWNGNPTGLELTEITTDQHGPADE